MTVESEPVRLNALFIVDRSASLAEPLAGSSLTRWQRVRASIERTLERLDGALETGTEVHLGLFLSPETAVGCERGACCQEPGEPIVEMAGAESALPRVQQALATAELAGASPMAAMLETGRDFFTSGAGAELAGNKMIIVVTDGGFNCGGQECMPAECTLEHDPSEGCSASGTHCCEDAAWGCSDRDAVLDSVSALDDWGIPTHVVAVRPNELYGAALDDLDTLDVTDDVDGQVPALDLVGLARDYVTETSPCWLRLESSLAADAGRLRVFFDCSEVDAAPAPGEDGWVLETTGAPTLHFSGERCERIQRGEVQRIDVLEVCR
jgi:hypothetical protein